MLKKSPSGSLCPYHYKGGELQPLHYGSYHDDLVRLFEVMDAEEVFILQSHGGRKVWIDLYETDKTAVFYEKLTSHLATIGHKLFKLALCGCTWKDQRAITKRLNQKGFCVPTRYFSDPEIAKDWLVGQLS